MADVVWVVPGSSAISGTYRGKDEVAGFFMTLASTSFQVVPQHVIADGDHVAVLARTTTDGQSADQANVLTFRGGKVAKFLDIGDTDLTGEHLGQEVSRGVTLR